MKQSLCSVLLALAAAPALAQMAGPAPTGPVSPPVRAAEQVRQQAEPGSDQQLAPQWRVPLRRQGDERPSQGTGTIDDGAARCIAMAEGAKRAACERRTAP